MRMRPRDIVCQNCHIYQVTSWTKCLNCDWPFERHCPVKKKLTDEFNGADI